MMKRFYDVIMLTISLGFWSIAGSAADVRVTLTNDIELRQIAENVYVHTTYTDYPGYGRISANGLIVIDGATAALIDTPWNDDQTGTLFDWVSQQHQATIKHVIVGHAHDDCLGGPVTVRMAARNC